ncbi:MAG: asparagine synthase (glutamine-hydrolyzing) [Candidatus Acidiferrales bacterium]
MCGIAGVVVGNSTLRFLSAAQQMTTALLHRGPDSHSVQDLGRCLLANTRLAIVDLSDRGRQPMTNEDSTVWITYNGECYNAAELRPTLLAHGHQFRSSTDTEVILHLYEEYGEECVKHLRGMFAFAIWDSRAQKLLLARDRLGIKPLYYSVGEEAFLFASEIKAMLASELLPRKLDPAGTRAFLELGHIPPPWTAIQGIKPLEPGHIAVWRGGLFRTKPYWKLPAATNRIPHRRPEEISADVREILLDSSRKQLMSDVPIALFLSGGVDSAVLGALMSRAGADQLTALTIGFEENSFDESEASRRTAEILGIPRRVISLPSSRVADSLDHALWAMDQPTVDGLNAYWISRAAAEAGFKVALSGQGGDELFGGYDSLAWFDRFSHVASGLRAFPQVIGRGLLDHEAFPFRWRKLSYLVGADDPFVAAQLAVRVLFLEKDVRELLKPAFASSNSHSEAAKHILAWTEQTKGQDLQERVAFLDFPAYLEPRLLRDGDAMSMAHSLELRPVLLDHPIVEYVMSLPISLRLQKKRLLLDALRDSLPAELHSDLSQRPKRGFTFPFARWLGGSLRKTIEDVFRPDRLAVAGVLDSGAVNKLWRRYLAKPESVGWSRLWSVFVLARWCEIMQVGA